LYEVFPIAAQLSLLKQSIEQMRIERLIGGVVSSNSGFSFRFILLIEFIKTAFAVTPMATRSRFGKTYSAKSLITRSLDSESESPRSS